MRALFGFVGGMGHLEPLVPFARELEAAGHEVVFAAAPPMAGAVEREGLGVMPLEASPARPAERLPLRPVDRAHEERELAERFVRRAARDRVPRLREALHRWKPDLLVCDETDFGAMLAAEIAGVPRAVVLVIASGAFVRADVVGEPLAELRREVGLPADPALGMLRGQGVLAPFPPSLRSPAHPLPEGARAFRPAVLHRAPGPRPWQAARPEAPTVYLTLGTIFPQESGDLFATVLGGLRDLPIEVVATVGPGLGPEELGPQPPHVHVARFLPQVDVLAHCDAVVCHGGSGSVVGALAHGLPMAVIPLGADQPWNADRCEALGVGRVLDAMEASEARVAEGVADVLASRELRANAARLREEIVALPPTSAAVPYLEALAAAGR